MNIQYLFRVMWTAFHGSKANATHSQWPMWGVSCEKPVSMARTSNYTPYILWDVITCPYPWHLILAQHSSYKGMSSGSSDFDRSFTFLVTLHYTDVIMTTMASQITRPHGCLLKRLFGCRSKKTSQLRVTGLCAGNSPVTGEFPAQMASNADNFSIWWRHNEAK